MCGWCHGAPGILLSRMALLDILPDNEQIKKDLRRAVNALFYGEPENKICLCHGLAGNLMVMKKYLAQNPDQNLKKEYRKQFGYLEEKLWSTERLMVTETLNPAFMNGITGVGMALMLLSVD